MHRMRYKFLSRERTGRRMTTTIGVKERKEEKKAWRKRKNKTYQPKMKRKKNIQVKIKRNKLNK